MAAAVVVILVLSLSRDHNRRPLQTTTRSKLQTASKNFKKDEQIYEELRFRLQIEFHTYIYICFLITMHESFRFMLNWGEKKQWRVAWIAP